METKEFKVMVTGVNIYSTDGYGYAYSKRINFSNGLSFYIDDDTADTNNSSLNTLERFDVVTIIVTTKKGGIFSSEKQEVRLLKNHTVEERLAEAKKKYNF